ncbi:Ig-like domain-containing protein [Lactiplantibacillus carotarum]|uniref:Ig-like domain-containing protein n=1 Tax=Lactiplantibacillus carotarum TaxID=2993456 RepID=UPI00298F1914|nr:Ig-like domain-containing protein [Lactiplantibacillus carotarum]
MQTKRQWIGLVAALILGTSGGPLISHAETNSSTNAGKVRVVQADTSSSTTNSTTSTSSTSNTSSSSARQSVTKRIDAPVNAKAATPTTEAQSAVEKVTLAGMRVTKTAVSGHTVAGATVAMVNEHQIVTGTTTADAQGNFQLNITNTAPFSLRATKENQAPATWQYVANFKLTKVRVARQTVTGRAVAGAKVKLVNANNKTVATVSADASGAFTINTASAVNTQSFTLKASAKHYHATSWRYQVPLKLSKLKVTKQRVSGHTTAGARVKLVSTKQKTLGQAKANAKGNFSVQTHRTVNGAPFNVVATKTGYRTGTWHYTAPMKLTRVKVAGKRVTGHAVAGAMVKVTDAKGKLLGRSTANPHGDFTVRTKISLTTKPVTVRATKARYHAASWKYRAKKLNVPLIAQRPELPTGCEITAVTMMLQYKGCRVTKLSLANEMPRSNNPNKGFVGNPYASSGWTIYPPALMKLVRKHAHSATNLTGVSLNTLKKQIDRKHPVTLWVAGVHGFTTHALTMTGYSPTRIYYNDPWTHQKTSMSNASFKAAWRKDGYRALSY